MFFAVIGNNFELCQKELAFLHPSRVEQIDEHLVLFDTVETEKISQLAGLVKWGKVFPFKEIEKKLYDQEGGTKRILGIADHNLGLGFKKKYKMKRFKPVELLHTDMDVKKKGIELVKLGKEWGIVEGYQDIALYEVVDFKKPVRSMQVGMMPAKLTHQLVMIGLSYLEKKGKKEKKSLIFDPFCGMGTTGFIANALGFDFVGSDLQIDSALKNKQWREKNVHFSQGKIFEFFQQDCTKAFSSKFQILSKFVPVIVTEGWLGPIVSKNTTSAEIQQFQKEVQNVYLGFLRNIREMFAENPVMVFTIPYYLGQENFLENEIENLARKYEWKMESISDVYRRENQKVGRKVLVLW